MQFHIENMTCGGCAKSVARVINALDPGAKIDADPLTRIVNIETSAAREAVATALAGAGWDAHANQLEVPLK